MLKQKGNIPTLYTNEKLKERIIHFAGSQPLIFDKEQDKEEKLALAYTKANGDNIIFLTPLIFNHKWSDEKIIQMIAHEKAHIYFNHLCNPTKEDCHNEAWRLKCIEYGGNGQETLVVPHIQDSEFITALKLTDGSDAAQQQLMNQFLDQGSDPMEMFKQCFSLQFPSLPFPDATK